MSRFNLFLGIIGNVFSYCWHVSLAIILAAFQLISFATLLLSLFSDGAKFNVSLGKGFALLAGKLCSQVVKSKWILSQRRMKIKISVSRVKYAN